MKIIIAQIKKSNFITHLVESGIDVPKTKTTQELWDEYDKSQILAMYFEEYSDDNTDEILHYWGCPGLTPGRLALPDPTCLRSHSGCQDSV